ncbi:GNAT family N-acetyltransferase [Enterococcus mediterraneensis]|uniref:GNAT family N-acetyltransferase n=1 Tax=Enterococcus mediterraneensis TaxID=2364791 RepID=UPI000F07192C|nr:GNAT family N-acetyltransferase [Enterococcus mediterraneensis]
MIIVQTKDTMSQIYLDALKIRYQVFVKEQGVQLEREIDKDEAYAVHFVLYEDNEALATVRLLPVDETTMKLQRMAVKKEARHRGLGNIIIAEAEKFAKQQGFTTIKLGAQLTAQEFYEKMGYQAYGEVFLDAGIQHIAMKKEL